MGKRVVVVGLSYTGADTIDALRGVAKEIYISHKHGAVVVRLQPLSLGRYLADVTGPPRN